MPILTSSTLSDDTLGPSDGDGVYEGLLEGMGSAQRAAALQDMVNADEAKSAASEVSVSYTVPGSDWEYVQFGDGNAFVTNLESGEKHRATGLSDAAMEAMWHTPSQTANLDSTFGGGAGHGSAAGISPDPLMEAAGPPTRLYKPEKQEKSAAHVQPVDWLRAIAILGTEDDKQVEFEDPESGKRFRLREGDYLPGTNHELSFIDHEKGDVVVTTPTGWYLMQRDRR